MQSSESSTHAIERREALNYVEFMERYCRPRRPVILTDAISHSPAATRWTPAYFAERVGDRRVDIDGRSYTDGTMIGPGISTRPSERDARSVHAVSSPARARSRAPTVIPDRHATPRGRRPHDRRQRW